MATNNSSDNKFTNSADGFVLGGGTIERDLTLSGANTALTGSTGANTYTFPVATSTLASLNLVEIFTNKDLSSTTNTFPYLYLTKFSPATNEIIPTGYSSTIAGYYEIVNTYYLEIQSGATFAII